jgi:hypothetical protein
MGSQDQDRGETPIIGRMPTDKIGGGVRPKPGTAISGLKRSCRTWKPGA